MANNFLRYKLFLISRASYEEIVTAVKEIFARAEVTPLGKIDGANHIEISFESELGVDTSASVAAMMQTLARIDGECLVKGITKLSGSEKTSAVIDGSVNIRNGKAHVLQGFNAKASPTMNFKFGASARVYREIFYPAIRILNSLGVSSNPSARSSVSAKASGTRAELGVKPEIDVSDTQRAKISSHSDAFVLLEANVLQPSATGVHGLILLPFAPLASLPQVQAPKISANIENSLSGKANLYILTFLSDYDDLYLSEMDDSDLRSLDYKEN